MHWRRRWQPTPVPLPGKSHGRRSLVGCSPWDRKESDTTDRLHFHLSLSCIGEGNGNPLQYPCLENPRDGGAWWAAVYGVAQSRRRLKGFSGGSSSSGVHGKPILLSASHEQALYFHVLWPLLILRRINPVRIINAHFTDKKTKAWGG